MQQNELVVKLDGVRTGIFAYMPDKDDQRKIHSLITFGERKTWLFRNYDIMMSTLINNHYKLNEIRYAFKFGENEYASFNDFEFIKGEYVGYLSGQKTILIPDNSRRVVRIGYIQIDSDSNNGIELASEIQKTTFRIFKMAAKKIPELYLGRAEIETYDENGMFMIKMNDNTVALHIGSNSKMANINKQRKQAEKPVFPFDKEISKYTTLYVYGDKDMYEKIEYDGIIDVVLKDIADIINTSFEGVHCTLIPMELKKKLFI